MVAIAGIFAALELLLAHITTLALKKEHGRCVRVMTR
jgi:hypothetical protein